VGQRRLRARRARKQHEEVKKVREDPGSASKLRMMR
jgi:hypothetical protein